MPTLFFSDKHMDGTSVHGPMLTYLVFEKTTIVLLDILRQISIKHERGYLRVGQLRAIFYLDIFALDRWRWRLLDNRKHHLVELGSSHAGCCLLYTSPSPRDLSTSRMPSSA